MKKYLLLLFFILIPIVYAAVPLYSSYNVYLDGQPLDYLNLSVVYCWDSRNLADIDQSRYTPLSYDPVKNCTWLIWKNSFNECGCDCSSNPCTVTLGLSGRKVYLVTPEKTILSDEIFEEDFGEYNLFINSDGSVESVFVRKIVRSDSLTGIFRELDLFELSFFMTIILLLEMGTAYLYFRNKTIPYKGLWSVLLINVITCMVFSLIINSLIIPVIILWLLMIIIEALFYKWKISEFQWKDVFILSLLTNISNIVFIVIMPIVLMIWLFFTL